MPAYAPPMTPEGAAPAASLASQLPCDCVTALHGCMAGSTICQEGGCHFSTVDVSPHCGCASYDNTYAFCYVNDPSACAEATPSSQFDGVSWRYCSLAATGMPSLSPPPQPPAPLGSPPPPPSPPGCTADYSDCFYSRCCASDNMLCLMRAGRQYAQCRRSASSPCRDDENWLCPSTWMTTPPPHTGF